MSRILVDPERLHYLARILREGAEQLQTASFHAERAFQGMDAEYRQKIILTERFQASARMGRRLYERAVEMASQLERKAQLFEEADRKGVQDLRVPALVTACSPIAGRSFPEQLGWLKKSIAERQKRITDAHLDIPESKFIASIYDSDASVQKVLEPENRTIIEEMAQRYHISPALLAGVIASEMDFDYDYKDAFADNFSMAGIGLDAGPGLASVHGPTLIEAQKRLLDEQLPGADFASKYDLSPQNRVSFRGTVEAAAIVTSMYAHEMGQVNSIEDMSVVYSAYRNGIKGYIPGDSNYGFESIADYRNHIARDSQNISQELRIGANAYLTQPYFEFFSLAFSDASQVQPITIPLRPTPEP